MYRAARKKTFSRILVVIMSLIKEVDTQLHSYENAKSLCILNNGIINFQ